MKIHPEITENMILAAFEESAFGMSDYGFCNACAAERGSTEPDAREYLCEECGEHEVYGSEIFLLELDI